MYFAWLGFYTSAMVYPAVFGSVLYTFTEADQVSGVGQVWAGAPKTPSSPGQPGQQLNPPLPPLDKPGCILCGLCPVQRGLVNAILGGVETEGGRAGLQVGDAGLTRGSCGGATTPVQGQSEVTESKDSENGGLEAQSTVGAKKGSGKSSYSIKKNVPSEGPYILRGERWEVRFERLGRVHLVGALGNQRPVGGN